MRRPESAEVAIAASARIKTQWLSQSRGRTALAARPVPTVAEQDVLDSHSAGGQCEQGSCEVLRHDAPSAAVIEWVALCISDMA